MSPFQDNTVNGFNCYLHIFWIFYTLLSLKRNEHTLNPSVNFIAFLTQKVSIIVIYLQFYFGCIEKCFDSSGMFIAIFEANLPHCSNWNCLIVQNIFSGQSVIMFETKLLFCWKKIFLDSFSENRHFRCQSNGIEFSRAQSRGLIISDEQQQVSISDIKYQMFFHQLHWKMTSSFPRVWLMERINTFEILTLSTILL